MNASIPSAPSVVIVIVAYNDAPSLRACFASLRQSVFTGYRVVLVDNSTTDAIQAEFSTMSGVEYLRTGFNTGFSRGCNLGITRSIELGAEYTWLLNPDTEVESACLEELVRAARAFPLAGIIGARIHYASVPAKTWYAGGRLDFISGVGKHLDERGIEARKTGYVTGCSMLIPNTVLTQVGGLEESIFMYQDDAEFCMRVRAAGYILIYAPAARMAHAVGPGIDWRKYPDYYLYFSVRNRPLISRHPVYRTYLHGIALLLATVKIFRYLSWPGVPQRWSKVNALAWGAWDSLFSAAQETKRLPALFQKAPENNPAFVTFVEDVT